jgi:hypothetical protein
MLLLLFSVKCESEKAEEAVTASREEGLRRSTETSQQEIHTKSPDCNSGHITAYMIQR